MKFGQTWKNEIKSMPIFLQDNAINYKKYKKVSKVFDDTDTIKRMLTNDLKNCENIYRRIHKSATCKPKLCFAQQQIDNKTVLKFAKLNQRCIYKLCKRIDKRKGINKMKEFYNGLILDPTMHMFSRKEHVLLDLNSAFETNTECPICLEPFHDDVLVLKCGHLLCLNCSLDVHGVKNKKGTIHNRIAHGAFMNKNASKCPVCQSKKAFQDFAELRI